jgi:hypothetical protein
VNGGVSVNKVRELELTNHTKFKIQRRRLQAASRLQAAVRKKNKNNLHGNFVYVIYYDVIYYE